MKKKKGEKDKKQKRQKVWNTSFTRVVPDNPPDGVNINNSGRFYMDKQP